MHMQKVKKIKTVCKLVIIRKKGDGERKNKNKCFIVNLHRAWMHASVYKSCKFVTHVCIYIYMNMDSKSVYYMLPIKVLLG